MIQLLLFLALANPAAAEDAPLWAGIPLDQLAALSLGEPTLHALDSGWKAPLPAGGFVQLNLYTSVQEAAENFAFQRQAATSIPQPLLDLAPGIEAVGDGLQFVMFLDRNVLVIIRDPAGGASALAAALRDYLQEDSGQEEPIYRQLAINNQQVSWDRFGRREVTP